MRISAAVVLVLLGCVPAPVSSSGHMRLQDEMAIMAIVDSTRGSTAPRPAVLDVVHLGETLGVSNERTLYFSENTKRDSLWLADPAQVARCIEDVMPRCLAMRILQLKRSGDIVEMEVYWWYYRGCGDGTTIFQVKTSANQVSIVNEVITEVGDCGMRSGKPLPPDSAGALHQNLKREIQ